jgi:hypothetical protein
MIPFWQAHSPAEIALETMLDAVWCIAWLIGLSPHQHRHRLNGSLSGADSMW